MSTLYDQFKCRPQTCKQAAEFREKHPLRAAYIEIAEQQWGVEMHDEDHEDTSAWWVLFLAGAWHEHSKANPSATRADFMQWAGLTEEDFARPSSQ